MSFNRSSCRSQAVAAKGHRRAIADGFETAKTEFGLDRNETRSWHGWHRPVWLVRLAFAPRATIRPQANPATPKNQTAESPALPLIRWSIQKIRRMAVRLAQRRIHPAHILACPLWRRAYQAAGQPSPQKRNVQL